MRNVALITGGRFATQAVLVVSALAIPRVLGADSFGLFAGVMAVIAILQTASGFGLPMIELRFLAPMWRLADRAEPVELGSSIWTARAVLSVLASGVVVLWLSGSARLGIGAQLCAVLGILALLRFVHEATKSLLFPFGRPGALALFDFARAALTLPLVLIVFPFFDLDGVFAALVLLQALLLVASWIALGRIARISPTDFRWPALRPHLPYAVASFLGTASGTFQAQFSIYAVANWVTQAQAGYLGLAVQLYTAMQVSFLSTRRALMPILSELHLQGDARRLAYWGGVMLRYSAAALSALAVVWALVGESLVRLLLTEAFLPVYPCATAILVSVMFYCAAASCNSLLYVRGLARAGATNSLLYAAATVGGLLWVLRSDSGDPAFDISRVYAVAAAFFFACAYVSLGLLTRLWLPLRRTLVLMTPALLAPLAMGWAADGPVRIVAALAFLAAYAGLALGLRLLPASELREILAAARRASSPARR